MDFLVNDLLVLFIEQSNSIVCTKWQYLWINQVKSLNMSNIWDGNFEFLVQFPLLEELSIDEHIPKY